MGLIKETLEQALGLSIAQTFAPLCIGGAAGLLPLRHFTRAHRQGSPELLHQKALE